MKAPLSSIAVAADRVRDEHGGELPAPVQADVARISGLAERAVRMIAELLAATKLVAEAEPVGTVDLGALMSEAIEELQPQIAERRIRVEVTTALPAIPGQAGKLRHVFVNLIGNAIRFVPAETGVVEIGAAQEDGCVVVLVRDNGVGIPAQYQETIFRMFGRVPGSVNGAGSGMGLAIVKRIVEAHGGSVWVSSQPGAGAAFSVRLPASRLAAWSIPTQ